MKEAEHGGNTKGGLFWQNQDLFLTWHLNFFPHGNNCITHRQGNRSATSKQDTVDIIHFEHQFEPTNWFLCYLESALWKKRKENHISFIASNCVCVCVCGYSRKPVGNCVCCCSSKQYEHMMWTIKKPPTPQSPRHYVFFSGLLLKSAYFLCSSVVFQ